MNLGMVIDADSHVSEPPDLWTSRVSTQRWGDLVPHVRLDEEARVDRWWWAGEPSYPTGLMAAAGWREHLPSFPPTLDDADPGAWDAGSRLDRMDEYGIYAQVIYPNLGGFGSGRFINLSDPQLQLACVRAYNDFLTEWCSADPVRLLPIMALPFWDLSSCIDEIVRCAEMGHRGILFTGDPDRFGQPFLADRYWDPLWSVAQELGLPINFHIGNADADPITAPPFAGTSQLTHYAKLAVAAFMANSRHIVEVITEGICERFPDLAFVSVESGVGWVPFMLEALDWQWDNYGVRRERPDMSLRPSEYFRRQVFSCFWFEERCVIPVLEAYPDNVLYETDYPHPTSMSPGPASTARRPQDYIQDVLAGLPADTRRKVLFDNAARLYRVEI